MHQQPDLFLPCCGQLKARQGELFRDEGRESSLACAECGACLVETPSGYLACPRGHGKLRMAHVEEGAEDA